MAYSMHFKQITNLTSLTNLGKFISLWHQSLSHNCLIISYSCSFGSFAASPHSSHIAWQFLWVSSFFWVLTVVLWVPLFAFDPHEDGGLAEPKLCGELCSTLCGFRLLSLPTGQSICSLFHLTLSPFLNLFTNVILFSMSIKLPTCSPSFV